MKPLTWSYWLVLLLGIPSSYATELGLNSNSSIPAWSAAGPFFDQTSDQRPNTNNVTWATAFGDQEGTVHLDDVFQTKRDKPRQAYLRATVLSENQQELNLWVRHDDGCELWLNQVQIFSRPNRGGPDPVTHFHPVKLQAGTNSLLCRVFQTEGELLLQAGLQKDKAPASVKILTPNSDPTNMISACRIEVLPVIRQTSTGEVWTAAITVQSAPLTNVTLILKSAAWKEPMNHVVGNFSLGNNRFELELPAWSGQTTLDLEFRSEGFTRTFLGLPSQSPKKWTVYLTQHTHTDIGYTRPQTEILAEHLRYIDYALDYCDQTDGHPDDAKFRWTCETAWAPREYLRGRPQSQLQRLQKRINEGRIELCAMLLNMSEIATESSLAASLQPIGQFQQELGLKEPIVTAMQNDVNGAGWCLVDYFSDIGVKYLNMGINKTRSILPFDRPTLFWWESPAGKRIIAYRGDHYMVGNFWNINQTNLAKFKPGVISYLSGLAKKGYAFDEIGVQFSGYFTDNSPPSTTACDLIKEWNETYAWPRLRLSTAHEFLDAVAAKHAKELSVHRQAWPDWWTDGFGSAARETAASRNIHDSLQLSSGLFAISSMLGSTIKPHVQNEIKGIQDNLLFYDEHTLGAAESINDPLAENSQVQWAEKSSYAWTSVKDANLLREEAFGVLQEVLPRADVPSIAVVNTLNWTRSGLIEAFIDHEILPQNRKFRIIDPESGEPLPAQALSSRAEGTYWAIWVNKVPALGYKLLRIEVLAETEQKPKASATASHSFTNAYYELSFDPNRAALTRLIDKQTGRNLIDESSPWGLGQPIYETLPNRDLIREAFQRSSLTNGQVEAGVDGRIWTSFIFKGALNGCSDQNGFRMELRVFKPEKRIEFHYTIRKLPVAKPESLYVAFPFSAPDAVIRYEAQGGVVIPGKTQIPGSSSDWQTIQSFVSILRPDSDSQIIWGSDEMPLVQLGEINLGKWMRQTEVKKPYVYSWVLNNYWFTNFRATQEGELKWSYYLTSLTDSALTAAHRFGWGSRLRFAVRIFPAAQAKESRPAMLSAFNVQVPNLLLVESRPALKGTGVILQVRELDGKTTTVSASDITSVLPITSVSEVNVLEQTLHDNVDAVTFKPYDVKFIHVTF